MRWIDEIIYDAKAYGIKSWRVVALDREKWKKCLEDAKIQECVFAPVMMICIKILVWYLILLARNARELMFKSWSRYFFNCNINYQYYLHESEIDILI